MTYSDGTAGHSGSDTSQARAERERDNGTKPLREQTVLRYLDAATGIGVTYQELCEMYGWHHGQASSVLSTLHLEGKIVRLTRRRGKCKVYVLPQYANGYPTEPHGGRKAERDLAIKRVQRASQRINHWYEWATGDAGPNAFHNPIDIAALDEARRILNGDLP